MLHQDLPWIRETILKGIIQGVQDLQCPILKGIILEVQDLQSQKEMQIVCLWVTGLKDLHLVNLDLDSIKSLC